MKMIKVEGYDVEITKADGKFVAAVPRLPGCIVQVDREEDARGEIRKMMGLYLQGMAAQKPKSAQEAAKLKGR